MLLFLGLSYNNSKTIIILSLDNSKNISYSLYQFPGRDSLSLRDPGLKMSWSLSRAHVFKNNFKSNFKNNFKSMTWNDIEPVISELTRWSGSLTRLASDLGQVLQKYVCMVHLQVTYNSVVSFLREVLIWRFLNFATSSWTLSFSGMQGTGNGSRSLVRLHSCGLSSLRDRFLQGSWYVDLIINLALR